MERDDGAPASVPHVKAARIMTLVTDLTSRRADTTALLIHLALVAALMIVFPVSKLLHAPGVFFSPTLNQVDDAREHRHVAGWSARLR